jgi:hypothetical protein
VPQDWFGIAQRTHAEAERAAVLAAVDVRAQALLVAHRLRDLEQVRRRKVNANSASSSRRCISKCAMTARR